MSQAGPTSTDTATQRRPARTDLGEGDEYWFYGDLAIVRSPEGARPIIIEHHMSRGASTPLHVHNDLDDSFLLLSGTLAVRCADETLVARAGDYVSMPVGVPHVFRVVGDEDAVLLQTHATTTFLDFIKAVGTPAERGRPDPASLDYAAMNQVASETGQPVLGPPMTAEEGDAIVAADR